MKCLLGVITLFALSAIPLDAYAIQRSCGAGYEIEFISANGTPLPAGLSITPQNLEFYARRGCGVPDRCRRRARDAAHDCMDDHWFSGATTKPLLCTSEGVRDYPVDDIRAEVRSAACLYLQGFSTLALRVRGWTTGDSGCSRRTTLSQSFIVSCP